MKPSIALIGPGRVGCALGHMLHMAGYPIAAVIGRDQKKTEEAAGFIGCNPGLATTELQHASKGSIVLLALPDDQLRELSARLTTETDLAPDATLIHFSGLHPASMLKRKRTDLGLLSIHPLLPFADRQMAIENLKDCPCAIEGDQDRLHLGQELVAAIGGQPFLLSSDSKQLYHAAACIASNFMVSLTATARDLLIDCGFEAEQAMQLLAPIHKATSENIMELGPEQALTGPIVRGDVETVKLHLSALRNHSKELARTYRELAGMTLKLAQQSGRLPSDKAEILRKQIHE